MSDLYDFSQQLAREKALYRYMSAFSRGNFDVMDEVLQQSMRDPLLEEMILESHDYLQDEEQALLREEEVAKILDLIVQHLPSGIPDAEEPINVPPLTMNDVLISLQEDKTIQSALKQEVHQVQAIVSSSSPPLPKHLAFKDISHLFAQLNISVSLNLQKLFRDKAIILTMGHQRGIAQLAAARRQKKQVQQKHHFGKDI